MSKKTLNLLHLSLQFKDQVVREAVEKICREFSGQCCIHKPLGGGGAGGAGGGGGTGEAVGGGEAQQVPEVSSSTLPGAPSSSTPPCSSCRGQTTGGGFQCRYLNNIFQLRPYFFCLGDSFSFLNIQNLKMGSSLPPAALLSLHVFHFSWDYPLSHPSLSFPFSISLLFCLSVVSVCTSCTLCEPCSFSHDPSHNLVRARTPLSIPEHGSPAPDHSR